jgi:hypothetical protein
MGRATNLESVLESGQFAPCISIMKLSGGTSSKYHRKSGNYENRDSNDFQERRYILEPSEPLVRESEDYTDKYDEYGNWN